MGEPRIPSLLHSHEHDTVHNSTQTLPGTEIELATIRRLLSSVLLVGPDDSNERVLSKLLPCCRTPVHEWNPECELPTVGRGVVVLRRIESLRPDQQRMLHEWFRRERRGVQIVSLASPRLFELVSTDAFHKALFYRLNVIMLMTSGR
jgi:hypothetical protein